ncbi:MAG: reprolysin-like metallopeptidase, partial [Candidatus Methylumidiphilus sp.]
MPLPRRASQTRRLLWVALVLAGAAWAGDDLHRAAVKRSLSLALQDISARSGVAFRLAEGLGADKISATLDGQSWQDAVQTLLRGYNYAVEANPDGTWKTVTISGRNGDGHNAKPPQAGPAAQRRKPSALSADLQALKPGSVTPIDLPLVTLKGMKPGQKIALPLPNGEQRFVHDNRHKHSNGETTWTAYAEQDGPPYRALLTLGKAGPMGHILTTEGQYQIVTEDGQSYLIDLAASGLQSGSLLEDQAAPGGGITALPAQAAVSPPRPADNAAAGPVTIIDLLVLHSKTLANAATRINYLVSLSNQAYRDSHINAQIRVVHRQPVDYTDSNDNAQALADLSDGQAAFANIATLRGQYGADLVTLIRPFHADAQKGCGVAWVNGHHGGGLDAKLAYSVVSDGGDQGGTLVYCGAQALAHELGHNLGNVHDRPFSDFPGAYPYSYAWGIEGSFGTIMSYRQPAIFLFASPLLADDCRGQPCGYAEGEADASD